MKGGGTVDHSNRLEELVTRYENTLFRTALAILGDVPEAEDAVQDALVRYLEKRPAFRDAGHERAWLLKVTANGCKSRLRARRRHPWVELLDVYPAPDGDSREVLEAVLSLPPRYKDAVYLHYYEGYTAPEISRILGKNVNTVYTLLGRARQLLKEKLGGEGDE